MAIRNISETVEVPAGITASMKDGIVSISGPKGKVAKKVVLKDVKIELKGNKFEINGEIMGAGTARSHIANLIKGAKDGYLQNMKIIYAHFPVSLEIKGKEVWIKNFVGEKQPRKAKICGDTKVDVKGQALVLTSPSKEDLGQTVANLRTATKIKNRDSRIFQDGIYPVDE